MAQGPNYNVILPFSTAAGIAVPSTIVVGGLTVNGDINAQRFVALNNGVQATPAFTFAGTGTNTGMFLNSATPAIEFAFQGTTLGGFVYRTFAGSGVTVPALMLGSLVNRSYVTIDPVTTSGFVFYAANATTLASINTNIVAVQPASTNSGLRYFDGTAGFVFDVNGSPAILNTNVPDGYAATWDVVTSQYFCKPGVTAYATTTMTPSVTRSLSTISNLLTAANNTLFVTLPTSIAGVKYTIANAKATGQTVVINPVAADVLNVFGLTKAAGASVAASAAFASITFHCITSTQWLATDIMGTWV